MTAVTAVRGNNDHDVHISLCELRFNEQSSSFEVAIKIFIDDLELAMRKEGVANLYIGTPNEKENAGDAIASYLNHHFSIEIDGHKLAPVFIGKEVTDDQLAVWCYVEYKKDLSGADKCVLTNRILFDLYADQRNIMDIRMGQSHKDYTILESGKTSWSYNF